MKSGRLQAALLWGLLAVGTARAAVHYVDLNNSAPTPPYTTWGTAATNIQDAVDAATAGDRILVTNGVYRTGGKAVFGSMTNRVAIQEGVEVRSVNGPQITAIEGRVAPGYTNGDGAVRCAYVGTNSLLIGFTLTNGHTRTSGSPFKEQSGGGAWCEVSGVISNCILRGSSAKAYGGGVYSGTLKNCTLNNNWVDPLFYGATLYGYGGGAYAATLCDCTLIANSAYNTGGGAYGGTLISCIVISNSAAAGGGADSAYLSNSTLTANSAKYPPGNPEGQFDGGGAYLCTLVNCILLDNSAGSYGGGAYGCTLTNCVLNGNWASYGGGGTANGALNNCTLVYNSAYYGGGAYRGVLNNCILYWNFLGDPTGAGLDYFEATLNYSRATPLPSGPGNIAIDPAFLGLPCCYDLRLQSNSPCINAGGKAYAAGSTDLAGNPRIVGGTVDMGAYEFQAPSSVLSYAWAQQFGLPTDGSADYLDSDNDLMNNWQEWIAGTVPTDAASVLRLDNPAKAVSGITVSWQSVTNRTYLLERGTNFGVQPAFSPVATNIVGQAGTTSYSDTNAIGPGPFFYRVGVQ
jgi:hypothetical protein